MIYIFMLPAEWITQLVPFEKAVPESLVYSEQIGLLFLLGTFNFFTLFIKMHINAGLVFTADTCRIAFQV